MRDNPGKGLVGIRCIREPNVKKWIRIRIRRRLIIERENAYLFILVYAFQVGFNPNLPCPKW